MTDIFYNTVAPFYITDADHYYSLENIMRRDQIEYEIPINVDNNIYNNINARI